MNFLLINADQLRADSVGYRGLRPVKTPNLDRLAAESVDYADAFTPLPVCSPARQSILCGRHPDSFGAQWNYDFMPTPRLNPDWCWPKTLQAQGWNTGYIGTFHVTPEHDATEYGYSDFYNFADHRRYLKEKYPDIQYTGGWMGCSNPVPLEDSPTHWTAGRAVELLQKYTAQSKPWHLWVDFAEPHLPCRPSAPYDTMYDPEDVKPWDGYGDTFEGKPYIQRQQTISWETDGYTWEKDWKYMVARYYGVISQLDEALGRILDALRASGQWEETVVVFTSDHGDMCGSHNMLDKHYVLYDDILRVPLLVKKPGQKARISREFVHNCLDIPASLPDWLGIALPQKPHGMPLPENEQDEQGREYIVCTSNGQQFGLYSTRCIRDREWKYVWNMTDVDELYHIPEDPGEKHNLIRDPAQTMRVDAMRKTLWAELMSHGDPFVKSDWIQNQLLHGKKWVPN